MKVRMGSAWLTCSFPSQSRGLGYTQGLTFRLRAIVQNAEILLTD